MLANARLKAKAVAAQLEDAAAETVVIACDTDVVHESRILGKPADRAEAARYLQLLSGRSHEVISALVLRRGAEERHGVARSRVTFRELDREQIERYLDTEEWRDRAGGYAIQGWGSSLVAGVEGDISNVIGLPVPILIELAPELRA